MESAKQERNLDLMKDGNMQLVDMPERASAMQMAKSCKWDTAQLKWVHESPAKMGHEISCKTIKKFLPMKKHSKSALHKWDTRNGTPAEMRCCTGKRK